MEKSFGLSHLFMTVFLHSFSNFMMIPALTDVTMEALCPGEAECSLVIYLTGAQQAIIGLGSLVIMPLVGNLSDVYGRKVMLTVPLTLSIFPILILAYSRTKYYFYAYYVLKCLTAMATDGTVQFLALAYVADNVSVSSRSAVFGIMSGFASSSFVFGNFSTRFLSISGVFQVSAAISVVALVYMRVFLQESMMMNSINCGKSTETDCLLEKAPSQKWSLFKTLHSLHESISLLRTSPTFFKVASVAFFAYAADFGIYTSLMYYLKAEFDFSKDQFANMMIIIGIAGAMSQLILMPTLTPLLGEENMLSLGLFFTCAHMVLYSVAWASWVPYASAMMSVLASFAIPTLRSIASKQTGPSEQGKVQGCITGICSFAGVISPLAFSPLTDNAPFHFPGFSIMCAGLAAMIAFVQSMTIRPPPTPSKSSCSDIGSSSQSAEPLV